MPNYLPIGEERIIGFIFFPRVLALCQMQTALFRVWTQVPESTSYKCLLHDIHGCISSVTQSSRHLNSTCKLNVIVLLRPPFVHWGGYGITVIVNGPGKQIQILDEAVCISLFTNTFGKSMNPSLLPSRYLEQTELFSLQWWLFEKEISEIKPTALHWKIDLVVHPVHRRGFG